MAGVRSDDAAIQQIVLECMANAVVVTDRDGVIQWVNPAFTRLSGYRFDEAVGRNPRLLRSGVHGDEFYAQLWSTILEGKVWHGEIVERHKEGHLYTVSQTITPLLDEAGEVTGFVSVHEDVTDLEASQARLKALFDHSLDAILLADDEGRHLDANPSAERLTGYSRAELLRLRSTDLAAVNVSPEALAARWQEFLDMGELAGELPLRRRDGSVVETEFRAAANIQPGVHLSIFRDITARKRAEQQLMRKAYVDPLTGLGNRVRFFEQLDRALAGPQQPGQPAAAVAFMDLDDFKRINDSLGSDVGDEVLREVARRLVAVVGTEPTVARVTGDGFAVVLAGAGRREAESVARRVLDELERPVQLADREVLLSASIGVTVAGPGLGSSDQLLRAATLAMRAAKSRGKDRCVTFEPEMQRTVDTELALETELRRALAEGGLWLAYQPMFDLATGDVLGVEALLRWEHPDLGLVPPGEFVPLAERSGLIWPLGEWVLEEACRQLAAWDAGLPEVTPLRLAVNISPRQLDRPGLAAALAGALDGNGLAPGRVVLEVTESALAEGPGSLQRLRELRDVGVELAIDDFGTGYSSLGRMQLAPVSWIKLDRVFVAEIRDRAAPVPIVRAILAMARGLGLDVVAEGIETPEQLGQLRDLGCLAGQGFLLSRPAPPDQVAEVLRAGVHWPPGGEEALGPVTSTDRRAEQR